jgi:hypothetical protein
MNERKKETNIRKRRGRTERERNKRKRGEQKEEPPQARGRRG